MHHVHIHNLTSLAGSMLTFIGGLVAQVTPTTGVGAAGLIMSITGLLMAVLQYYKTWTDSKNYVGKIEDLKAENQGIKDDLNDAREGRHADANRFNVMILELRADLVEEKAQRARLQGKLGLTDSTHAAAINANRDNIVAVAEQTGADLPKPPPHLHVAGPESESKSEPESESESEE